MGHSRCGHLACAWGHADEIWEGEVDDLWALCEEAIEERKGEGVRLQGEPCERGWHRRQEIRVERGESECCEGTHRAQRQAEGEMEGRAVRGRVSREHESRHERREVRRSCETCDACVRFCCGRCGQLERAVKRQLCGSAEPARDASEGGELCAGDVRKDERERDGRILASLAARLARAVRLVGLWSRRNDDGLVGLWWLVFWWRWRWYNSFADGAQEGG